MPAPNETQKFFEHIVKIFQSQKKPTLELTYLTQEAGKSLGFELGGNPEARMEATLLLALSKTVDRDLRPLVPSLSVTVLVPKAYANLAMTTAKGLAEAAIAQSPKNSNLFKFVLGCVGKLVLEPAPLQVMNPPACWVAYGFKKGSDLTPPWIAEKLVSNLDFELWISTCL